LVDSLVPVSSYAPGQGVKAQPKPPPVPGTESTVSEQSNEKTGGTAKGISKKTFVFGIAGGIGAAVGELLSEPFNGSFQSFLGGVLFVSLWAALISLGVSVGLLTAQSIYLKKAPRSKSLVKTAVLGILSGAIAGALAQLIFAFTYNISTMAEITSRIICWGLMACGVGLGVSLFVPNYPRKRAALAGLLGGIIGGAIFRASFGFLPELAGRIFGIAVLGVSIGLTISIVEEMLREAWITVDWGRNETTNVSLGVRPVVFGSSPDADIYLPRNKFPPAALIIRIENSRVMADNKLTHRYTELTDGGEINMGTMRIIVHVKKGTVK
jgi:Ca-activated chloride channel family protein